MRRERARSLLLVCSLALHVAGVQTFAQEPRPPAEAKPAAPAKPARDAKPKVAPRDGTFKLLGWKIGVAKVVKGAPYSATAVTESVQTLGDGNQIIRRQEAKYYRDGEGRTRIERRLASVGKWTADGDPPLLVTIFDPVAGHAYNLDPRTRTAFRDPHGPLPPAKPEACKSGRKDQSEALRDKLAKLEANPSGVPPEKLKELKAELAKELDEKKSAMKGEPSPPAAGRDPSEKKKGEPLGRRNIGGVEAEGTRSTRTIPAGEIGNTRPIEIVDESWYSNDLRMVVMTRHSDPRNGEVVWRLSDIKRAEPGRALFEVPADYTVVGKRSPKRPAGESGGGARPKRPARNDP